MRRFELYGVLWIITTVDPRSSILVDRTGKRTIACTNPSTKTIYISSDIKDAELLRSVLIHELTHAAMVSTGFVEGIGSVDLEERICNFIADNAENILNLADTI